MKWKRRIGTKKRSNKDSNPSRSYRPASGHLFDDFETYMAFKDMVSDYGTSMSDALNRYIKEGLRLYRIPEYVQKQKPEWKHRETESPAPMEDKKVAEAVLEEQFRAEEKAVKEAD